MKNVFTIEYDKNVAKYATMLHDLVAKCPKYKSVKTNTKQIESKVVSLTSKDNVIHIGVDCSKERYDDFIEKYDKMGIHIGINGSQAWIYCEKFEWTKETYEEFFNNIRELYKVLGLKEKSWENNDSGLESDPNNHKNDGKNVGELWNYSVLAQSTLIPESRFFDKLKKKFFLVEKIEKIINYVRRLLSESNRIDMQYRYAIVYFFHHMLDEYMENINKETE